MAQVYLSTDAALYTFEVLQPLITWTSNVPDTITGGSLFLQTMVFFSPGGVIFNLLYMTLFFILSSHPMLFYYLI